MAQSCRGPAALLTGAQQKAFPGCFRFNSLCPLAPSPAPDQRSLHPHRKSQAVLHKPACVPSQCSGQSENVPDDQVHADSCLQEDRRNPPSAVPWCLFEDPWQPSQQHCGQHQMLVCKSSFLESPSCHRLRQLVKAFHLNQASECTRPCVMLCPNLPLPAAALSLFPCPAV